MSEKYPKQTKQQQEAAREIAKLLSEAAIRMSAIDATFKNQVYPASIVVDFTYLQLRMLCETVALICLVAHGDIDASRTSKLHKDYAADNIINKLEQLHTGFYPQPITASQTLGDINIEKIPSGFLTKSELVSLYHECGTKLHRGSLAKFRSTSPKAHSIDVAKIQIWREKFVILLNSFHIASLNNLSHYVCFISSQQYNGNPMVLHALSPLPA